MKFIKNLFKLPSPKELGMSDSDCLGMRRLSPYSKSHSNYPTWEDWEERVKELHPIKYWFVKVLGRFVRNNVAKVSHFFYWLSCHLLPSRKYHLLDLRQPHNEDWTDNYRYGYIDVSEKMLYALFNLLSEFVNDEHINDPIKYFTAEEIEEDPGLKKQQSVINEAKAIYYWWSVERKLDYKKYSDILGNLIKAKSAEEYALMSDEANKILDDIESKTEEMVIRLVKIRKDLWN